MQYELGTKEPINLAEHLCVDCASPRVMVLSYETEGYSRITKLQEDVRDLQARIEVMMHDEESKCPN